MPRAGEAGAPRVSPSARRAESPAAGAVAPGGPPTDVRPQGVGALGAGEVAATGAGGGADGPGGGGGPGGAGTRGHTGVPALAQLGDIRVERLIAEGGMGAVYLGWQHQPSRPVAVKVVNRDCHQFEFAERFAQEIQLSATNHEGIVTVYAAGKLPHNCPIGNAGWPYMVMEFIEQAEHLTRAMTTHRASLRQRLDMLVGAARAVGAFHQRGIVHRDLKPSNILVNTSRKDLPVKIADFGLAKTLGDAARSGVTFSVSQSRTILYAAPEQLGTDLTAVDTRSDVYSLALIACEALVGRLPYDLPHGGRGAPGQALMLIKQRPVLALREISAGFPPDLEAVLLKALSPDRTRRYADAGEFADDLARARDGEPVAALEQQPAQALLSTARRSVARAPVLAAILLILGVGLGSEWLLRTMLLPQSVALAMQRSRPSLADIPIEVDRFEHVRLLPLTDTTPIDQLRATHRISAEISRREVLRQLHTKALPRIAAARPRAIVWDIIFEEPSDYEKMLAESNRLAIAQQIPVVFPVSSWEEKSMDQITVGLTTVRNARAGSAIAGFGPDGPWFVPIFRLPQGRAPLMSLSLQALAAAQQPALRATVVADRAPPVPAPGSIATTGGAGAAGAVPPRPGSSHLAFNDPDASPILLAGSFNLVTAEDAAKLKAELNAGYTTNDQFIDVQIVAPAVKVYEDAVGVSFAQLLAEETLSRETEEQLRAQIGGKVVVIGDWRTDVTGDVPPAGAGKALKPPTPDLFPHDDGAAAGDPAGAPKRVRMVPGSVGHATAIELMLRHVAFTESPPRAATLSALAVLAAGLGVGLAFALRRAWLIGASVAAISISIVVVSALLLRQHGHYLPPTGMVVALLMGCGLALALGLRRRTAWAPPDLAPELPMQTAS